ncbi:MAG: ATP-binding protein [Prochlorothrix sp.]
MTTISPRILIVDDSTLALRLYRSYLETDEEQRYAIELSNSGSKALEICRQNPPDLVLLDYAMPHLNGSEFLAQLRTFATPAQILVVVITMLEAADLAVEVMKAGAQDCLFKIKLTPAAVRRSIRTALDYRDLQLRLQHQQDLQQLLSSITLQIRQCLTLDEILNTLVTLLRACLKVDRVLICTPGEQLSPTDLPTQVKILAVSEQPTCICSSLSLGSYPADPWLQLFQSPHPDYPQAHVCTRPFPLDSPDWEARILSQLAVPITLPRQQDGYGKLDQAPSCSILETLWGWIVAEQCTYARSWQPWEIELLEQLAVQATIAIQQAELYDRLQSWNTELEVRVAERTQALWKAERALRHLNRDLEVRVVKRTHELQAMNERFQQLVAHINEVFWVVNLNPIELVYISPGYRKIWDQEEEELYAHVQDWLQVVHPLDQAEVLRLCRAALDTHQISFECRLLCPDRAVRWIEVEGATLVDEEGTAYRFVGRAADITERKRSRAELTHQRDLREAIFNDATDALLLLEPNNLKIVDCNQRAITLFEAEGKHQFLGRSFTHLPQQSFSTRQLMSLTTELDTQGFWYSEVEFRTFQAMPFWGNVAAKSVQSMAPRLYLVRITDVTSQKEAEDRIYRSLQEAEELSELKSRFIAMTSHEFRTPLAVISSSVGILQHFGDRLSPEKRDEHLATIQTYIQHTTRLLDDILLLNRAGSEELRFEPAPLNVVAFCERICHEIQESYPDYAICFTVVYGSLVDQPHSAANPTIANLTPSDDPAPSIEYNLDEKLLRQILINLLSNAVKYSAAHTQIEVILTLDSHSIQIEVKDQGIGIPASDMPQLFQSFHRASNVGTIQGTGLGLSIVKHCLDLHKGYISVQSVEGGGSCFTVTLPLICEIDSGD